MPPLAPMIVTGAQPGGLLTTTSIVENYPGSPEGIDGTELLMRMQKQAERFGTNVRYGIVITKVDFTKRPFRLWADDEEIQARTVIIAAGASHRHLGLKSEDLLERKGVTYCATCDGAFPMFRNQPLVVVGGGDSACEEATYLTRFGSRVYLVHRRDELRASKIMADRALQNPKVEPVWDSVVEEFRALGGEAVASYAGVDDPVGAQSIIDSCLEAFGKVDVLVDNGWSVGSQNNAGQAVSGSGDKEGTGIKERNVSGWLRELLKGDARKEAQSLDSSSSSARKNDLNNSSAVITEQCYHYPERSYDFPASASAPAAASEDMDPRAISF